MSKDTHTLGPELGQSGYGAIPGGQPPPGGVALPGMDNLAGPSMPQPQGAEAPPPTAPYTAPPPAYSDVGYNTGPGYPPGPAGYPPSQPSGYPEGGGGYPQQAAYPQPSPYPQQAGGYQHGYPSGYNGPEGDGAPKGYAPPPMVSPPGPTVIMTQPTAANTLILAAALRERSEPREWSNGLFGCFNNTNLCLLSWCCSCYLMGKNAEAFGESFCIYCCCSLMPLFRVVLETIMRTRVREKRNIRGSMAMDCCTVYWCTCCALIQETFEIRAMEEEATIVRE